VTSRRGGLTACPPPPSAEERQEPLMTLEHEGNPPRPLAGAAREATFNTISGGTFRDVVQSHSIDSLVMGDSVEALRTSRFLTCYAATKNLLSDLYDTRKHFGLARDAVRAGAAVLRVDLRGSPGPLPDQGNRVRGGRVHPRTPLRRTDAPGAGGGPGSSGGDVPGDRARAGRGRPGRAGAGDPGRALRAAPSRPPEVPGPEHPPDGAARPPGTPARAAGAGGAAVGGARTSA